MSLFDYEFVSGCRCCSGGHQGHGHTLTHGGYAFPAMDHLKTRMAYRAIRRELRQLMDQLPKGTQRGRL